MLLNVLLERAGTPPPPTTALQDENKRRLDEEVPDVPLGPRPAPAPPNAPLFLRTDISNRKPEVSSSHALR